MLGLCAVIPLVLWSKEDSPIKKKVKVQHEYTRH